MFIGAFTVFSEKNPASMSWKVGTDPVAGSAPILGPKTRYWLLGGFEVGPDALIRFYTLHVIGLPLLAAIFMAVHFWRIRRDGGLARPL